MRDYSALVAAQERHQAQLLGQPVHTDPFEAAAALLHAIEQAIAAQLAAVSSGSR